MLLEKTIMDHHWYFISWSYRCPTLTETFNFVPNRVVPNTDFWRTYQISWHKPIFYKNWIGSGEICLDEFPKINIILIWLMMQKTEISENSELDFKCFSRFLIGYPNLSLRKMQKCREKGSNFVLDQIFKTFWYISFTISFS